MEVSNRVLQSLSGFRDLTAAMNDFLDNASNQTYAATVDTLSRQDALLKDMYAQMRDGETARRNSPRSWRPWARSARKSMR